MNEDGAEKRGPQLATADIDQDDERTIGLSPRIPRLASPVNGELSPERERIKVRLYAVGRARCPNCRHRWPWPSNAPTPAEAMLLQETVACPRCHRAVALEAEPADECWWAWATASPMAKLARGRRREGVLA